MKKSYLFTLFGLLLGTGAPLGIFIPRFLFSATPFATFLAQEWTLHYYFYLYMLINTCLVFAIFGFFIGRSEDHLIRKDAVLSKEVLTDPLTGLGNHRYLHDTFKIEFRRHLTNRLPISCFMLDLDHFKRINDTYGHPFGDYVLKHFAMIFRRCLREGDTVARYGGEEFLCILPNCDQVQGRIVAERIRKATQRHLFVQNNHRVQLTVSLGVVTSYESSGLNYRQLIALADQALYEAKEKGRNRIIQNTIRMSKNFNRRKVS